MHVPQAMHSAEVNSKGVLTFLLIPRLIMLIALTPTISSHARTQSPHNTQESASESVNLGSSTPNSVAKAMTSGVR
jgi:hypothetical protein